MSTFFRDKLFKAAAKLAAAAIILLLSLHGPVQAGAVYTVTNALATGVGSLAAAIDSANNNPNGGVTDTIKFNIPGVGPHTITLSDSLLFTDKVVVDGFSQSGALPNTLPTGNNMSLKIKLVFDYAGSGTTIFRFNAGSGGSLVKGLRFEGSETTGCMFFDRECRLEGSELLSTGFAGVILGGVGCKIGSALPAGRVVISNSHTQNVTIAEDSCSIAGSFVGTDITGTISQSDTSTLVYIGFGALNVKIGGVLPGERNVIAGNSDACIEVLNGVNCEIFGNYIGLDTSGTLPIHSSGFGIYIRSPQCHVGDTMSGYGNVISGHSFAGIVIAGSDAQVRGNLIGTDFTGTVPIPNGSGIRIDATSSLDGRKAVVGGSSAATRNIISGNTGWGIEVVGSDSNVFLNNYIGLDATGTSPIPNGAGGIVINSSSHDCTIGSESFIDGNVISGNTGSGVAINGRANRVLSNLIGLDASGAAAVPNDTGIAVHGRSNQIGGAGSSCYVSGNTGPFVGDGIVTFGDSNICVNCVVGLSPLNTIVPNGGPDQAGINLRSDFNTISNCVVSGNLTWGIKIIGNHNILQGTYVGTDTSGQLSRPNSWIGITVSGDSNQVGVKGSDRRNVVSGNESYGVLVQGGSIGTSILGNLLGTSRDARSTLPNLFQPIYVSANSTLGPIKNVTIGDGTAEGRNYIIGKSDVSAIVLDATDSLLSSVTIAGNFIGTNHTKQIQSVSARGIRIRGNVESVNIGGSTTDSQNVITNTLQAGILVEGVLLPSGSPTSDTTPNYINIAGNQIYGNSGLGIDHLPLGIQSNDPLDADVGPNNLQNFPVIDSAMTDEFQTTIYGTLNSEASKSYTLHFYANDACNAIGYGEGQYPLGSTSVLTNGSGDESFTYVVSPSIDAGKVVTATATDPSGNTSEFSACRIVALPMFVVVPTVDTADIFFLARADLDRDNRTDFIYTGTTDDSLFVAFGNVNDSLDTPIALADVQRAAITVDYLDGDTLLDIIARSATQLFVLRNLGNRTFSLSSSPLARVNSPVSTSFPAVTSGYFNTDANLDIIASENRLLLGDGVGGFATTATLPFNFDDVATADFNGDYIDDIVITRADSAVILLNDGNAVFSQSASFQLATGSFDYTRVRTGIDVNLDGRNDLITLAGNSVGGNDTSVLLIGLGNGLGGITLSDSLLVPGRGLNLTTADFDRDNDLDISVIAADDRELRLFRGEASGQFTLETAVDLGAGSGALYGLSYADLDRDGNADLIAGGSAGTSIVLAYNDSPADSIALEELVVTGFDDEFVEIRDPNGLVISDRLQTVAGSSYGRVDFDNNGRLDDRAFNYNLQPGTYTITTGYRPAPLSPVRHIDVGIGINGFQERVVFQNYNPGTTNPGDTIQFTFQYPDKTSPGSGVATNSNQPTLTWSQSFVPQRVAAITYRVQISSFHDFRSVFLDTSGLSSPALQIKSPLAVDSVYFWRVAYGDNPFSAPVSLYVNGDCCQFQTGNVDCDLAQSVDIADLTVLVDHLFISFAALCCVEEADVLPDASIDIADLTALVDHLFISFVVLPNCP